LFVVPAELVTFDKWFRINEYLPRAKRLDRGIAGSVSIVVPISGPVDALALQKNVGTIILFTKDNDTIILLTADADTINLTTGQAGTITLFTKDVRTIDNGS